jgi:hypothetical protein
LLREDQFRLTYDVIERAVLYVQEQIFLTAVVMIEGSLGDTGRCSNIADACAFIRARSRGRFPLAAVDPLLRAQHGLRRAGQSAA